MSHDIYPRQHKVEGDAVPAPEIQGTETYKIPTQGPPPRQEGGYSRQPVDDIETRKAKKKRALRVGGVAAVLTGLAAGIAVEMGISHSQSVGASSPETSNSAVPVPGPSSTESAPSSQTQPSNVEVDPQTLQMKVGDTLCNGIDSCAKIFEVTAHDKVDYKAGFVGIVNAIESYENPANGPAVHNQAGEDAFKAAFVEALVDPSSTQQAGIISTAEQNREYNIKYGTTSKYDNINTDFSYLGDLKSGLGTTATMTHSFINKDGQPRPGTTVTLNVSYGIKTPSDANKYDLTLWQSAKIDN